jgi:hypothetical protein
LLGFLLSFVFVLRCSIPVTLGLCVFGLVVFRFLLRYARLFFICWLDLGHGVDDLHSPVSNCLWSADGPVVPGVCCSLTIMYHHCYVLSW